MLPILLSLLVSPAQAQKEVRVGGCFSDLLSDCALFGVVAEYGHGPYSIGISTGFPALYFMTNAKYHLDFNNLRPFVGLGAGMIAMPGFFAPLGGLSLGTDYSFNKVILRGQMTYALDLTGEMGSLLLYNAIDIDIPLNVGFSVLWRL